jgi:hypothetical protein
MHAITVTYRLHTGQRGTIEGIFASTCASVVWALDHFGPALRSCSARRAG